MLMNESMKTIQPTELHTTRQHTPGARLLDVRTPAEHARVHVPGVDLVPLDKLDPTHLSSGLGMSKDEPVYILCHAGTRAKQAAEKLERSGFRECHVVEGGTSAWADAGLPVNRGTSRVLPLDRQVRITIGTVVASGVVLGYLVNPAFFLLSGFMGAGLIFAGVTDWCGLAILMAKLPWNQRIEGTSCSTN